MQTIGYLSERQTAALTTLSPTTIWRKRKAGEFPDPVRISKGRVAYLRADIERWMNDRAAEGQAHAA